MKQVIKYQTTELFFSKLNVIKREGKYHDNTIGNKRDSNNKEKHVPHVKTLKGSPISHDKIA